MFILENQTSISCLSWFKVDSTSELTKASFTFLSMQAACCCGSSACMCCCARCPSCKNSTAARIVYTVLLLLGTIMSAVMLAPGIRDQLDKIPHFCTLAGKYSDSGCDNVVGYLAVYRVCFAMAAFFLIMAVMMFKVSSSRDPRAKFQNGLVNNKKDANFKESNVQACQ